MIKTVLEATAGKTKVVVEGEPGSYVVHILNASSGVYTYCSGGVLESDRRLTPRERAKIINLCEWVESRVSTKHVTGRFIAKVAETVLYQHRKEEGNDD